MGKIANSGRTLSASLLAVLSALALAGPGCATGATTSNTGDIDASANDASSDDSDVGNPDGAGDADAAPGTCATDGDCAHDPNGSACDTTTGKCVQCVPTNDWCPDGQYCDSKTNRCEPGCRTSIDCVAGAGDAGATDASVSDSGTDTGADIGVDTGVDSGADTGGGDGAAGDALASDADAGEAGPADTGTFDASVPPLVCDPTTHQCVGCMDSSQCPLGSLCDVTTNSCYPGCTPTHGCPGTFACCSGMCVDINVSTSDCGSCGKPCANVAGGAPACSKGTCVIGSCAAGKADCNGNYDDGCEVDTTVDPANCGACANVCSSINGSPSCVGSKCQITCNAGYANCDLDPSNGCEVNTNNDTSHCGTCATQCVTANDTPGCNSGVCVVVSCNTGYGDCNINPADGCETNLNTSTASCGKCNSPCSVANGTPVCNTGSCAIGSCSAGFDDCNSSYADGCETNLQNNGSNCGKCGDVCTAANGTSSCTAGTCTVAGCSTGYADCDKLYSDGCEINTTTDVKNCGGCGAVCSSANGTPSCVSSACQISCSTGFGNCDGSVANGCETNLNTSVSNCGSCGKACSLANATPTCTSGACAISTCAAGYADCDKLPADGCEVNLTSSTSNCGGCGKVCAPPNSVPACTGGGCAISSCVAPFANCDGLVADGCEVNAAIDPANCGGCGRVCNLANVAVNTCTAGVCTIGACAPGFADCDGNPLNGCETYVTGDPNNCGGCGTKCAFPNTATYGCAAGSCVVSTCNAGFGNCDGVNSNGCEANFATDPNNCSKCGSVCSAPNAATQCSAGTCGIAACSSGYANCDGLYANGCEINTASDGNNCGACGNACSAACVANVAATSCVSSTCGIVGCNANYYNVDGLCADGCECLQDAISGTCTAAQQLSTSLALGTSASANGNLVSGSESWYSVTYASNTATNYHPKVTLTSTSTEFSFSVYNACGGANPACGTEGGTAIGIPASPTGSVWEDTYYSTAGAFSSQNQIDPGYTPIVVGTANQIWIRVYRASGGVTCNSFTLTVSN